MTAQDEQAIDMVICESLTEFKMGLKTMTQALDEIKKAFEYYSKPENERN